MCVHRLVLFIMVGVSSEEKILRLAPSGALTVQSMGNHDQTRRSNALPLFLIILSSFDHLTETILWQPVSHLISGTTMVACYLAKSRLSAYKSHHINNTQGIKGTSWFVWSVQ